MLFSFLEKPIVRSVNGRIDMRMVRFWHSMMLVEIWASSGLPAITDRSMSTNLGGL